MKNFKYKLFNLLSDKLSSIAYWFECKSDYFAYKAIKFSPRSQEKSSITCNMITNEALKILGEHYNIQSGLNIHMSHLDTITIKKPARFKG